MNLKFLRNEVIAGFTTFFTMAYIVILNPIILKAAGMDPQAVFVATCLCAAFGCFAMGILANYPIALAPAMSLNAYFSFYVVQQLHFSWQTALGLVFIAGILFAILTATQLRQWLIYTMPHSLKMAISAGIGLFLVAIALKTLGVHVAVATWFNKATGLCSLGILLVFLLDYYRVLGAILIGMLAVTLLGIFFNPIHVAHIVTLPPSISPTFLKLEIPSLIHLQSIIVILIFLFVALFDNTGTLIAVLHQAKLLPEQRSDRKSVRLGRALFADSLGSIAGSLCGTSTIGSYIESVAGVRAGGRTGVTTITVGILFLCALFFAPMAAIIPNYAAAVALIYVGGLMTQSLKTIAWRDITESIPALICVSAIPITFSIADGIAAGFISHVALKKFFGKKIELGMLLVALICIIYLLAAHSLPHN
jgi:AGZA family xanthine/uracil permease-like MFS transporter